MIATASISIEGEGKMCISIYRNKTWTNVRMCVNVYRQHDNTITWHLYSTNFYSFHIFLLGFVHCEYNRGRRNVRHCKNVAFCGFCLWKCSLLSLETNVIIASLTQFMPTSRLIVVANTRIYTHNHAHAHNKYQGIRCKTIDSAEWILWI